MGILIGMDEAGYGPNLGPLVVAATAWHVGEGAGDGVWGTPSHVRKRRSSAGPVLLASQKSAAETRSLLPLHDFYRPLKSVVSRGPSETHIAIADSKALYKPGHGLRQLERGVHTVLAALDRSASCWTQVVASLAADPNGLHQNLCWHRDFDCRLPLDVNVDELLPLAERFAKSCESVRIRPLAIRARLVFPAEFNELVDKFGSKGTALSHTTIGLLREVIDSTLDESPSSTQPSIFALCDKHGARNRYAALLQHHFSEHWIEPIREAHAESRYEWGPPESRVQAAFRMKGEEFLPTALASMTAKYLRELSMRAFNQFWCARVPGLRPTAGYPGDASRFQQAIDQVRQELGVDNYLLWRNR